MNIPPILPAPTSWTPRPGYFRISPDTGVRADERLRAEAVMLSRALGLQIQLDAPGKEQALISLVWDDSMSDKLGREGYQLDISTEGVLLTAATPSGVFYGCQTLLQCVSPVFGSPEGEIPAMSILDQPRFGWRGCMLDVSRHFAPVSFIKKLLDQLAFYKLNVFHWHLTDDQGWRIEIKRYPRLTEVGSLRPQTLIGHERTQPHCFDGEPHGGYYTQEEIREVIAYAAERHITIVPEIDMPGHMQAAIAAYPELGNVEGITHPRCHWGVCENILNVKSETIQFMQNILEEVMDLFPGEYIHIGGDECVKDQWIESADAQAKMKSLGLANEEEMQRWFLQQMKDTIEARGRRLIGWEEIMEGGLAEGATVVSWRSMEKGIEAAQAGHDVVMAPQSHVYFDYYQCEDTEKEPLAIHGVTTLEKVYRYNPIPPELPASAHSHILGGQCQLWTEYMPNPSHVEYMLFPRLFAFAQTVWSPEGHEPYADFRERINPHLQRLMQASVNFRPPEV
ncbi:beta-N-acetylhexosaminidase [Kiritimatiellaeota bacterium B1221]|nr:beta-N-acetylhexosaminidase [Kiritimatiellaeota bacterium B1221]